MNYDIFKDFNEQINIKKINIYGINIYQNKKNINQKYRYDERINLYSGSKTYTALAIGICEDLGLLNTSDLVINYFEEYKNIAKKEFQNITIENLLYMNSGIKEYDFNIHEKQGNDWLEIFFTNEFQYKVGEKFAYSNSSTYILGRIVNKVTKIQLKDFLQKKVFDYMNIYNVQWHKCPNGYTLAAAGLHLSTQEFAKLGELFLNQGKIKETQIISQAFLKKMTSKFLDNNDNDKYGMHIWEHLDGYRADGMFGQFCIIFEKKNLCITITAHDERNTKDILKCVNETIVPYFK